MFRTEQIGDCKLYLGDCREVMASWPECFRVDAVVTDPPYGIGWVSNSKNRSNLARGKANRKIVGDDNEFNPQHFLQICKTAIFWGANNFANKLPNNYGWLVWDKRPNGESNTQSDCELAWTSFATSVRKHSQRWMGVMRDGEECPFKGGGLVHPTQKPVSLMRWCVAKTTGTVFDPFMGSGTTGVACVNLGRKFIGVEIEPDFFEIACDRIAKAVKEPRLPIPEPKPVQQSMDLT